MVTEVARLADEARLLRQSNERRQLAADVDRTIARVNSVRAEHRRLRAEPIVDEAIAAYKLPASEREEALRRFEISPELAKADLDRRKPDLRNRLDPQRDLAERERISRTYGIPIEDVS